ncbi:IclR family transcriptional regulator [Variovorax paradoxus]|uniref:IclR family transcriptional regulator n=1 Tax=Variovorax paradoxus TaxID=34073 RepID=UPI00193224D0|nr:helix-turn-helix domain-containing protein [Variovorax paradoxus]
MTSSLSKMLDILDLFDEETPAWTADGICERLELSTSSGYRYIRELCAKGLLSRTMGSTYILGTRIIELEYVMRVSDPVAKAGRPILEELSRVTTCDALLASLQGFHIVNLLHQRGVDDLQMPFTRGRQLSLFRGAISKAILSAMPRTQLVKLHALHQKEIAAAGMGESWLDFWLFLQAIKRAGFGESHGERRSNISGLSVPIASREWGVGGISLVYASKRRSELDTEELVARLKQAGARMNEALRKLGGPPGVATDVTRRS